MAHAKQSTPKISTQDEPINFSKEIPSGHLPLIVEPDVKEAEDKIWKTQVIIPGPNSPRAFLGPFVDNTEDLENHSVVFPCFEERSPLIFTQGPYDLSFLKSKLRTEPRYENNERYLCWLDKVENQKGQFWKEIGIYDLVQLSRQGPKYHSEMIIAALCYRDFRVSSH